MGTSLIIPSKPIPELVKQLDDIFMEDNVIKPVSLKQVDAIPRMDLRVYCHQKGIYSVITNELVTFLSGLIGSNAIEIGSGNGTLALGLKIHATDNWMQTRPEIAMAYLASGQVPIQYPKFVEKLDAIEAIKKYKPDVVLGSWITHIYKASEHGISGNMYAPDEEKIMSMCDKYIMVGNTDIHHHNRLFNKKKYKWKIHKPSCLRSRAKRPEKDVVFEFTKK